MVSLSTDTRRLSGRITGTRGSGKTLLAADQLWHYTKHGEGAIVIDPTGTFSNYFLAKRMTLSGIRVSGKFVIEAERICYVPMGGLVIDGAEWIVPTPLLYAMPRDTAMQDQAARVIEFFRKLHPEAANAPIQGLPAIERTTNYSAMLVGASQRQLVPEAASLLRETPLWRDVLLTFAAAVEKSAEFAELREPLHYFLEVYPRLSASDRRNETVAFLNLIDPLVINKRLTAQYGAMINGLPATPALAEEGKILLYDLSGLPAADRRYAGLWVFAMCMEYFRSRGQRRDLVNFVVDEMTFLADRHNPFLESDIEELIARIGRSYGIASLFTYQELTQLSPRLQQVLDMVGYSFFGGTNDPEASLMMARRLFDYQPKAVKHREEVMSTRFGYSDGSMAVERTIDTFYTVQEQEALWAAAQRVRKPFTFAVSLAEREGGTSRYVAEETYAELKDEFHFKALKHAPAMKHHSVRRIGYRLDALLATIEKQRVRNFTAEQKAQLARGASEYRHQETVGKSVETTEVGTSPHPLRIGPPPRVSTN